MKKLNLKLAGQDGNAFNLLGYFSKEAKKAGWSKEEISKVIEEAQNGDYEHLLSVLSNV